MSDLEVTPQPAKSTLIPIIEALNELYLDIVGIFLPGIAVTSLSLTLIYFIFYQFYWLVIAEPGNYYNMRIFSDFITFLKYVNQNIFIIGALSFVFGLLLSRRDLMIPDGISSMRMLLNRSKREDFHFGIFYIGPDDSEKDTKDYNLEKEYGVYINKMHIDSKNLLLYPISLSKIQASHKNMQAGESNQSDKNNIFNKLIDKILNIRYLFMKLYYGGKRLFHPYTYYNAIQELYYTKFPYLTLRCLLKGKGLEKEAELIPWCPLCPNSRFLCSKQFINNVKSKIYIYLPKAFSVLTKTEAQVRLFSTLWYGSRMILKILYWYAYLFIIYILLFVGYGVYIYFLTNQSSFYSCEKIGRFGVTLGIILFIFLICKLLKAKIEESFHSLRIRELVTIFTYAQQVNKIYQKYNLFPLYKCQCSFLQECKLIQGHTAKDKNILRFKICDKQTRPYSSNDRVDCDEEPFQRLSTNNDEKFIHIP